MADPDRFFLWLATAVYAAAVVNSAVRLFGGRERSSSLNYGILLTGFLFQTAGLYLRGMQLGACPLGNTLEIVQFVLWSTVFLYLVVGPVFRVHLLGSTTAALVSLASLATLLVPAWDRPHGRALFGGDPIIEFHAAVSVFGYGIFGLLATTSLLYLLQYLALERKWRSLIFNMLPSIVKLDGLAGRLLGAGLMVLTLAFVSGIMVWFDGAWEQMHLKLLAVGLLWFIYVAAWILRLSGRLSPRWSSVLFILLFALAILSLWPVKGARDSSAPTLPSADIRSPLLPADEHPAGPAQTNEESATQQ